MTIIDGKKISDEIKLEIKIEVDELVSKGHKRPHLAAILVGSDGGSITYVNHKVKACEQVGFKSTMLEFKDDISQKELLDCVHKLNNDSDIDGFIVQLPLPKHISENDIIEAINPKKDVDGFHPENFGRMSIGLPAFVSATPFGIVELLKRYKIETKGKHCVVLGRSNIVGRPVSILMSQKGIDATVTVAHSRTENLAEVCRSADILIVAIGSREFVKADMVKEGATVIDVGTSRLKSETTKS
ncbi:MAG: bifunctional 5,10-methylene-tetrahydrofolate dehydrogenase/5,10-methylene-tetrahydrofolate cyclohydrolase, partial [Bacteroidetes bacterium GWA2_31_9]